MRWLMSYPHVTLLTGGLTVDRWFHQIDILVAIGLITYTAIGIGAAYIRSVLGLFLIFFVQGSNETMLILGNNNGR